MLHMVLALALRVKDQEFHIVHVGHIVLDALDHVHVRFVCLVRDGHPNQDGILILRIPGVIHGGVLCVRVPAGSQTHCHCERQQYRKQLLHFLFLL